VDPGAEKREPLAALSLEAQETEDLVARFARRLAGRALAQLHLRSARESHRDRSQEGGQETTHEKRIHGSQSGGLYRGRALEIEPRAEVRGPKLAR
jgi:hypothetical protein